MTTHPPKLKTQTLLRAAGVLLLLVGAYLAWEAFDLAFSSIKALLRHEWFGLAADLGTFIVFLPITCLCLYAGWRVTRAPERANPRLLLMAIFILLYFHLFGLGRFYCFDDHGLHALRESLRHWEKLYSFAAMLLCSLLYYASCRGLRRLGGFTAAQQVTLAVPPSLHLCALIGLYFLFAAQEFIEPYLLKRDLDPHVPLFLWLGSLAFAFWFSRFLHRKLCVYLAPPVPPVPEAT